MPERYLVRDIKFSANPQSAPEKTAGMQAQEGNDVPKWQVANQRGRRIVRATIR